jgi:hypothetical protein
LDSPEEEVGQNGQVLIAEEPPTAGPNLTVINVVAPQSLCPNNFCPGFSRHGTTVLMNLHCRQTDAGFLQLDHITDDPTVNEALQTVEDTYKSPEAALPRVITTTASPLDTPKPDHFIPHGAVTEWTTSPIEDVASATQQDRLFASTSLSISMDMLPTPYGFRNGSVYEPFWSLPKLITRDSDHLVREPRVESITVTLEPGFIICSNEVDVDQTSLSLVRTLGQGSFTGNG